MPHFVSRKRMGYVKHKKSVVNRISWWRKMGKFFAKLKFKVGC
jgi:hypothetical protein